MALNSIKSIKTKQRTPDCRMSKNHVSIQMPANMSNWMHTPLTSVKVHVPPPANRPTRITMLSSMQQQTLQRQKNLAKRDRGNTITEENMEAHTVDTNVPDWLEKEGVQVGPNLEEIHRKRKGLPSRRKSRRGRRSRRRT